MASGYQSNRINSDRLFFVDPKMTPIHKERSWDMCLGPHGHTNIIFLLWQLVVAPLCIRNDIFHFWVLLLILDWSKVWEKVAIRICNTISNASGFIWCFRFVFLFQFLNLSNVNSKLNYSIWVWVNDFPILLLLWRFCVLELQIG